MLNFNGLIMCTLPLHTKRNILAQHCLTAVLNGRFIIFFFSLLRFFTKLS